MSVTEKLMAPGNFNVSLDMTKVPNSVVNAIQPYDHIVVMPTRVSDDELDDAAMIAASEYIGLIQGLEIDESNVVRSSTGIGLDVLTPIGPLSFSLSQPLSKKSTDKTETFRFSLGTTF